MNELQSVTDIDEVIKYAERRAEGCHQMASAYHTDEGVYLQEETRLQYRAILWENIHEWLEELKERRQVTGKLNSELEYKAKVKELEDAIAKCEQAKKEFERQHGEWIKFTLEGGFLSSYKCSNCGFCGNQLWHFCPSCGSDMRVKNELNRVSKELNSEIEKSKSEIVPDYRDGWRKRGEAE